MRYIDTLVEGETIRNIYLCKGKRSAETRNGKPYDNLILQDKTGTLDGKIWDPNSNGIADYSEKDFIEVYGEIISYNGNLQMNIKQLRVADEGEYDPADYEPLVQLVKDGKADVCYGTRLKGGKPSRSFMFHHLLGNKFLSFLTNLLYGSTLSDMETCYKAFKADFIKGIEIKSNRFDFEPEITAKVLKRGARLYELPVSYYGREFAEGKKITWRDGFNALWALI